MSNSYIYKRIFKDLSDFYEQDVYRDIGPALEKQSKKNKFLFGIVRLCAGRRTLDFFLMLLFAVFYRGYRLPEKGALVFQYGITENNKRAFKKLNDCFDDNLKEVISTNYRSASLRERCLVALSSIRELWRGALLLKDRSSKSPYIHMQLLMGGGACSFYRGSNSLSGVKVLCVANDHSPVPRVLMLLSQLEGIKVCYMQHAPVTEYFPALTSDLAILYDKHSLNVYKKKATKVGIKFNSTVALLPPFEERFKSPNLNSESQVLGVCLSRLPNLEELNRLLKRMVGLNNVNSIILRPHPASKSDISDLLRNEKVSEQKKFLDISNFLDEVDLVLVPNSGVAIECLHHGIPTFYTPGVDEVPDDYYGFVKKGVLPVLGDADLNLGSVREFFNEAWEEIFSEYDLTVEKSLEECRRSVYVEFLKLLA